MRLLLLLLLLGCGARGVNPGEDPRRPTSAEIRERDGREREDKALALPHSEANKLRYWQYGCPKDAEVRSVEVIELGETAKERRRKGHVTRWEVVCGERVLRCSQRHVLRCVWGPEP